MKQSIAGTDATPDQAQQVSDVAHEAWRDGADSWCRQMLEEFLQDPDSLGMERTQRAMKTVLRAVEARRRQSNKGE